MDDPDSFIYNFIFDLGEFFPFEVCLLGGRFYVSYSQRVVIIDDEFISNFKVFLQERLNLANSLIQPDTSASHRKYIEWISAFIEYELVNTEYRQIQKKFLSPDGQKTFILHFFNIFFDLIFFDSIALANKIDSFLHRIEQLPLIFDRILENFSSLPFSSLLDLYYISLTVSDYFLFLEEHINRLNINLLENSSYLLKKETVIRYFDSFNIKISSILKDYSCPEFDLNLRKEAFLKNFQYVISINQDLSMFDTEHIQSFKQKFLSDFLVMFQPPIPEEQAGQELREISKKTKIASNVIEQVYQIQCNEIIEKLNLKYNLNKKIDLNYLTMPTDSLFMDFNTIFISNSKLKRNTEAKFLLSKKNSFLSTVVVTILSEILPISIFLEKKINSSYIYSILRFPETEKSIKMFWLFLNLKLNITDSTEVKAACILQILTFLELSLLDLNLNYYQTFDRNAVLHSIRYSCSTNEMESEILLDHLLFLPGYYYISFFLFTNFCRLFEKSMEKNSIDQTLQRLFSFLEENYGAPPKVVLREIENII